MATQSVFAASSSSENGSVTVQVSRQVLAPLKYYTPSLYSNVRPEVNQISCLQFCACMNLGLYCIVVSLSALSTRISYLDFGFSLLQHIATIPITGIVSPVYTYVNWLYGRCLLSISCQFGS